jgi:yecA family protein
MSEYQRLDYYEVGEILARAQTALDAADCHGLLAGLVCGAGSADPRVWMRQLFEDFDPKDVAQAAAAKQVRALYEETLVRLNSPDLDFELLLPDDDDPLGERTAALGSWCGGFLSGLGLAGIADPSRLPETVSELIEDLTQIARVDFDVDDPDQEEQAAFAEVVEYVRVGVLLVNEELQPSKAPPQLQ